MTIHKEGRTILFVLMLVLVGINFAVGYFLTPSETVENGLVILSIGFYILILQFFRIPNRKIDINPNAIIAPADGKVVVIEKTVEDEYFHDERLQISIFMSPLNVHNNRTPVTGIVKKFVYHAGKYLVAWHPKSSTDNERTTMIVAMPNGVEVLVRQIAGAMARRIKWYVSEGQPIQQGDEYGFIKFGSRVDVFLPPTVKVLVETDTKTVGGKTILAEFN
jgi:phosphatidylserine decarboxylase